MKSGVTPGLFQFRVTALTELPNLRTDETVWTVGRVNLPAKNHGMTSTQMLPFRVAITEAIQSESVYWVDLIGAGEALVSSDPEEILEAIKNGQLVSLFDRPVD